MVLCANVPLVRPPAIRVNTGDANRGQERFELEQDVGLPASEHRGQHRARVMIHGVP